MALSCCCCECQGALFFVDFDVFALGGAGLPLLLDQGLAAALAVGGLAVGTRKLDGAAAVGQGAEADPGDPGRAARLRARSSSTRR